ncbi:hypothetical protein A3850_013885 [Lewinella sp. 4G2]|nr:hypothetical protein A3850_013885 [Lewinella sp. 4G2]
MFWAHCPWYWLWTLGAFLLGSLLTWLLTRRGDTEVVDNTQIIADRDRYKGAATKWETDYNSLKYQLEESQKAEADLRAGLASCNADKAILEQEVINTKASAAAAFAAGTGAGAAGNAALSGIAGAGNDRVAGDDATIIPAADLSGDAGGSVYDGLFAVDNFQIIEGVGPKVNEVLKANGYNEWADLAKADADDLRKMLQGAGKNFGLTDPTSWPHQAGLAAAGDWDELIKYQKFTDAGRETVGDFETPSKFEKLAAKELGFSSNNPNDLKVVEGIGPKIEGLLKADGINTWSDLAAADQSRLQGILDAAGSRYKMAIPRTWPQQAALAAAGDWKALKALQDDLQGGL